MATTCSADSRWNISYSDDNGGGRRVPLRWQEGDPIDKTRVTVPVEAVRIANLPDDYRKTRSPWGGRVGTTGWPRGAYGVEFE